MKLSKKIFDYVGVFPIINHYYEPLFREKDISKSLSFNRTLNAINFNIDNQLNNLNNYIFSQEFRDFVDKDKSFHFGNGSYESGDAEYLYNFVRYLKPKRIIEIGSGYSSLIINNAVNKNIQESTQYKCQHICIEPFEVPWLEKTGVNVLRKKVELIDITEFQKLEDGDFLFIDSSHIIRPQGDVLYEYLEILPNLAKGVSVHIHDIFTPNDYPKEWVFDQVKLWNEQYLLEAFLSNNDSWEITGSLNLLFNNHFDELKRVCIYLTKDRDPGAFYIKKIK
jgi:predicted O-methyltransferase YrrM